MKNFIAIVEVVHNLRHIFRFCGTFTDSFGYIDEQLLIGSRQKIDQWRDTCSFSDGRAISGYFSALTKGSHSIYDNLNMMIWFTWLHTIAISFHTHLHLLNLV